jgi:hypothetical protein
MVLWMAVVVVYPRVLAPVAGEQVEKVTERLGQPEWLSEEHALLRWEWNPPWYLCGPVIIVWTAKVDDGTIVNVVSQSR